MSYKYPLVKKQVSNLEEWIDQLIVEHYINDYDVFKNLQYDVDFPVNCSQVEELTAIYKDSVFYQLELLKGKILKQFNEKYYILTFLKEGKLDQFSAEILKKVLNLDSSVTKEELKTIILSDSNCFQYYQLIREFKILNWNFDISFFLHYSTLNQLQLIEMYGGEGKGDDYWIIYQYLPTKEYIKFVGWYNSYTGSTLTNCYLVKPEEKLITVFNPV